MAEQQLEKQWVNKLVRDRIPEIIHQAGRRCEVQTLTEVDYELALRQKLVEEAQEVAIAPTPEDLIQELADLQEVIDTLRSLHQIDPHAIALAQRHRRHERGGFSQRLSLVWSEVNRAEPV